jgi:hypothetical protein
VDYKSLWRKDKALWFVGLPTNFQQQVRKSVMIWSKAARI